MEVWVGDKMAPVLMTIGESGVACFGRSEPQFRDINFYPELLKLKNKYSINGLLKAVLCV